MKRDFVIGKGEGEREKEEKKKGKGELTEEKEAAKSTSQGGIGEPTEGQIDASVPFRIQIVRWKTAFLLSASILCHFQFHEQKRNAMFFRLGLGIKDEGYVFVNYEKNWGSYAKAF